MGDLIERTRAIDAIEKNAYRHTYLDQIIDIIKALPSAQPETHGKRTETHACDCIERQAAIDAHYEYCNKHPDASFPVWSLKILENLPSAQPDHTNNRVIKQTLDEVYAHAETEAEARFHAQQRWIPCSERLPENKSYVLTTIYIPGRQPHARSGWFEDGLFMNDNGDTWKSTDREVCAWMPLPEPYAERRTDGV